MAKNGYRVAVAGATGAVGQQMISCLEQRNFPVEAIKLLASARSKGRKLVFNDQETTVEELTTDSFSDIDIALFSAGGGTSEQFAPIAAKAGCVVVDNSSAWRMDPDVHLVVHEVNADEIADYTIL